MPISRQSPESQSHSDASPDQSLSNLIASNLNALDFARGLYAGAVEKPLDGIRQLAGAKIASENAKETPVAVKAGMIAGQIVDFSILAFASHSALKPIFKSAISEISGTSAKMFLAGAIDGGIFTTSGRDKSLLAGRTEAALTSATTFAIMGGASRALDGVNFFKSNSLIAGSLANAISGGAGGIATAYGNALFNEGRLAKFDEVVSSAAQFAVFGAGMHALHAGIGRGAVNPSLRDSYYSTKWKINEGSVEAKKMVYSTLNDMGMRHPIKRLGDLVYGAKVEAMKVPLTVDNHPVALFEEQYPLFIENIQNAEKKYERAPRQSRHDVYNEINEIKAQFAQELLTVWHGTAERPGMTSYSDAELAGRYPQKRVAEIRDALTASMKRPAYSEPSPFEAKMARLSAVELEGDLISYDLGMGLGTARERFFDYNERRLIDQLGLSKEHHVRNRDGDTPLSWMPFAASDKLANLFHCTTSKCLPSVFAEGNLLPARELRLRGIKQATGESADEDFPRRAISMTRDFSVAFCYHRHSPTMLNDFPVVFGMSKDVTEKSWQAGFSEPGELLTNKLRLGTSWMQKLGLSKPEITHLYVPDGQVDAVSHALKAHRIQGLKVVGFNDIDEPVWSGNSF